MSPTHCTKPSGPYVSSEELRALKLFIQEMAPVLTRYSGSNFWLQVVPQVACRYAAVRHALVACSLVNEAMNYQRGGAKYGKNDAALVHMNKAVRILTEEHPPVEVMLTIGLILQLLETLNNNARLAMLHLQSAINILAEYKQQLADGRISNKAQAEFIMKYLDPTLSLAMKFAEQTIAKSINTHKIDQHSREAFAIRAQVTQPDPADSFKNKGDAGNHLMATASKLVSLRAKYLRLNSKSLEKDSGTFYNGDHHMHLAVPSAVELLDISSDLEYFMRLYTPIYDNSKVDCRLLLAHAKTLQMILQDTSLAPYEDHRQCGTAQGDKLLKELLEINGETCSQPDCSTYKELGFISPLFYLASHSERCSLISRRLAIDCLKERGYHASEVEWDRCTAAFIAEEIVDLEEELGYEVPTSKHQFQYLDSAGNAVSEPCGHVGYLELWLSYTITHIMSPSSSGNGEKIYEALNPAEEYVRKCSRWTVPSIIKLPDNVNSLITNYGYHAEWSGAE